MTPSLIVWQELFLHHGRHSKEEKLVIYLWLLFRDLLVLYTFTTHPCSFSLCSPCSIWESLVERKIHNCLNSQTVFINRRHAILDAASIKNKPRLQCRCSCTLNIRVCNISKNSLCKWHICFRITHNRGDWALVWLERTPSCLVILVINVACLSRPPGSA